SQRVDRLRLYAHGKRLSHFPKSVSCPLCKPPGNPSASKDESFWETFPTVISEHRSQPGRNARFPESLYSRKPGFTETRFRPRARRRDKTAFPPLVFIRVRKPCVLERRRRLG